MSVLGGLYRLVPGPLRDLIEAYAGPLRKRRQHREKIRQIPSVEDALTTIQQRWPVTTPAELDDPVFVLSAGWRSGSTLLQRVVMSGGDTIVWGEPYDHCDYVRRLAESLRAFTPEYAPDEVFLHNRWTGDTQELDQQWVANLYPHPDHLATAHREFFKALYREPATKYGFSRWGFKEVRLSATYAAYLRWLFPNARFLFLIRNPYDAYRSYRTYRSWYDRWPGGPVLTPRGFGEHWRSLAQSFSDQTDQPGGIMVRYEALVRGDETDRIAEFLDTTINPDVLAKRIKGRSEKPGRAPDRAGSKDPPRVPATEMRLLRRAVEPLASRLAYQPATEHRTLRPAENQTGD